MDKEHFEDMNLHFRTPIKCTFTPLILCKMKASLMKWLGIKQTYHIFHKSHPSALCNTQSLHTTELNAK